MDSREFWPEFFRRQKKTGLRVKPNRQQLNSLCNLGLTESDIRDAEYAYDVDLIQVRLWNGRKLIYTGMELHYAGRYH